MTLVDIPHNFVIEALYPMPVRIKKMFGNYAIYVGNKIVPATRKNTTKPMDNGIWIGTSQEHHASLKSQFSSLTELKLYNIKKWTLLPEGAEYFEGIAFRICDLTKKSDPRIGVVNSKY